MRAGDLDRKITIERAARGEADEFNEATLTWTPLASPFAKVAETRGNEFLAAEQRVAERRAVFTIRFISGIRRTDRIVWDNECWDITSTREIGRRMALEIHAFVRQ
ncbi:MAG: phage head closure protein [Beijerinckiaceae bacterium]